MPLIPVKNGVEVSKGIICVAKTQVTTLALPYEEVSIKFVRLGAGELVTGGVEVTGWAWCPACREKRDSE